MIRAGVSSACLYPKLLEESVYDLAVNGIDHIEIFVNTDCELEKQYISGIAQTLKRFEVSCRSMHPFTSPIEPMLFFSGYERRLRDALEYYKKSGWQIVGLENNIKDKRLQKLGDAKLEDRVVLVLGEEVHGISPELFDVFDLFIEIPMKGKKESFNVSVAAGIALYGIMCL